MTTFKTFNEIALDLIKDIEQVHSVGEVLTYLPRMIAEVELGYKDFSKIPKKELVICSIEALAMKFLPQSEQQLLKDMISSGTLGSLIDETVELANWCKKSKKFCCMRT